MSLTPSSEPFIDTCPDLFEVADVGFHYPSPSSLPQSALRGLNFSVVPGERLALVGANGSGKSTLLLLLAALAFPSQGSLKFEGAPLREESFTAAPFAAKFRRRVQLVFQDSEVQLFNPTVEEEVAFGPLQLGTGATEAQARVEAALATLSIEHLRDRAPHRLSGGEKKRVAIASVVAIDPEVYLLDEPTAALDPRTQSQIIDFLNALPPEKTVIFATHDLNLVHAVATRCLVLNEGRLLVDNSPERVLCDEELLQSANLIHAHRHRHGPMIHAHPHLPGHDHGYK